jgi:hypothetical protein
LAGYKIDQTDDTGLRGEKHSDTELSLARRATRVLAVGPRLHDLYLRKLAPLPAVPEPLMIIPGFDRTSTAMRSTPVGRPRQILLIGRLDDIRVKGLDIAAQAVAKAIHGLGAAENEYELLLRGAPVTGHDELRRTLLHHAEHPLRMVTRSFSTDNETLHHDLQQATVMLMPSRAEAFGLAAAEAIAAGTPVLVSNRSGLGMLLNSLLPVEEVRRIVVPVVDAPDRDAESWARAIDRVLADPDAAFVNAARLQSLLEGRQTWAMAAAVVLEAIGRRRADALGAPPMQGHASVSGGKVSVEDKSVKPTHNRPRIKSSSPGQPTGASFSGEARLAFTRRLGRDWQELASLLEIDDYEVHRFAAGFEPGEVWDWLHRRRRLPELPEALRTIGRDDLAKVLEASVRATGFNNEGK